MTRGWLPPAKVVIAVRLEVNEYDSINDICTRTGMIEVIGIITELV